jgi:hypothetical protein
LANVKNEGLKSRKFKLPGIDDQQMPEDVWETDGKLKEIASRCLMTVMYVARTMRWDLLQPINTLARDVTKWCRNCYVRMHKLFCYIAQTTDHAMQAFCGDKPEELKLMCYVDASFADCTRTHKSTSGVYISLVGNNTFIPLAAVCKKQTCQSHSSIEAEIIALELGLRQ